MKTQILVIGRHIDILNTVVRLINQNDEWEARGTDNDEQAIELCSRQEFDLVLLGGGIETAQESKLRSLLKVLQPTVKIIQHFGGGSGLLYNEIQAALEGNAGGVYNIIEDPFKQMGLGNMAN